MDLVNAAMENRSLADLRLTAAPAAIMVVAAMAPALAVAEGRPLLSRETLDPILIVIVLFPVVGAVIAATIRGHRLAMVFTAVGATEACAQGAGAYGEAFGGELAGAAVAAWLGEWVWFPGFVLLVVFVPLLFPDGQLPSRRWRLVAWTAGAAVAIVAGLEVASGAGVVYDDGGLGAAIGGAAIPLTVVCGIAALTSPVVRYRRAGTLERQQLKWFGLIAGGAGNEAIARRLSLRSKTVRNQVSNIFVKLQVADRAQAIVMARDAGLGQR